MFAQKVVVEEVTNPGREMSLEEARELAGDEVDVGDELQIPLPMEEMGRIAAQTAKQILFQKKRDANLKKIHGRPRTFAMLISGTRSSKVPDFRAWLYVEGN